MYALKQALLLRHYIHGVEVTLYYMDIRAFGKGYEQFYRRAVSEGVSVVKGKVARDHPDRRLRPDAARRTTRRRRARRRTPLRPRRPQPGRDPGVARRRCHRHRRAADGFVHTPEVKLNPSFTTMPGVFVSGVAAGPKDIPDAIVEAGEAAMAAANHLTRNRWRTRMAWRRDEREN